MQESDESYCSAHYLYPLYVTDDGFKITSAPNILNKFSGIYDDCHGFFVVVVVIAIAMVMVIV